MDDLEFVLDKIIRALIRVIRRTINSLIHRTSNIEPPTENISDEEDDIEQNDLQE